MTGKSAGDFILEQACHQAMKILAQKTTFQLSSRQWREFTEILAAPVKPWPELLKLLAEPAPWEN